MPYVANEASFKPNITPNNVNTTQITVNDWLNPNTIQPIAKGILTIIRVFRRPIPSLIIPPRKLPIGCAR